MSWFRNLDESQLEDLDDVATMQIGKLCGCPITLLDRRKSTNSLEWNRSNASNNNFSAEQVKELNKLAGLVLPSFNIS